MIWRLDRRHNPSLNQLACVQHLVTSNEHKTDALQVDYRPRRPQHMASRLRRQSFYLAERHSLQWHEAPA